MSTRTIVDLKPEGIRSDSIIELFLSPILNFSKIDVDQICGYQKIFYFNMIKQIKL